QGQSRDFSLRSNLAYHSLSGLFYSIQRIVRVRPVYHPSHGFDIVHRPNWPLTLPPSGRNPPVSKTSSRMWRSLLPRRYTLASLVDKDKTFVVQRRGGGHGTTVVPDPADWPTPRWMYYLTNMLS